MRLALMQPYFFPYLGYFELVASVDEFVFYDEADFSKNSWYNRNRILSHNKEFEYLRVAVTNEKLGTAVRDVRLSSKDKDFIRNISICDIYKKAPFYSATLEIIRETFSSTGEGLADLSSRSIELTSQYIGINVSFKRSSDLTYSRDGGAQDKVISLCKAARASDYVNLSGGRALYNTEDFQGAGINLSFTAAPTLIYDQGPHRKTDHLSIIDTLMYCSPTEIKTYLQARI